MGILVRAIGIGYYSRLRSVGDVFEIGDVRAFSKRWMERVDPGDYVVHAGEATLKEFRARV